EDPFPFQQTRTPLLTARLVQMWFANLGFQELECCVETQT
ncbi:hypothetical protein NPIL_264631, partial [Nephila pilipes]